MAKITKPHLRHPVFCYVLRKVLRQIVRAHALSQLIHKDITVVLVVIAIAANFLVEFLRFLDLLKVVAEAPHQGKRSQARFGFSRILLDDLHGAVDRCFSDCSFDDQRSAIEIDRIPL